MKKLPIKKHHKKGLDELIAQEVDKEVREVKREWRHLVKFKDENYLLFTAFVILIAAIVIVNTAYVLNHNITLHNVSKSVIVPDSSKQLSSQQVGSNDAIRVRVSSVTENDQTDYAFSQDPNNTMLIMNISITNESNVTQQLIPVSQLYVRTNEGDYAALHASMYVTNPLASTDIAKGKTVRGQISFSVPKHIAHPLLYVDTGWNNNAPLVFDVLR